MVSPWRLGLVKSDQTSARHLTKNHHVFSGYSSPATWNGHNGVPFGFFHDSDLCPINFDVGWRGTIGRVTDISSLEHRVRCAVFFLEGHLACRTLEKEKKNLACITLGYIDRGDFDDLQLRSAYLRKYVWMATLLERKALSEILQALWFAKSFTPGCHKSVRPFGVFSCPFSKYFSLP